MVTPGTGGGVLIIRNSALDLGMIARARRQLAIAHGTGLSTGRQFGDGNAKLLEDPLCQIDQPSAHHAVDRWDLQRRNSDSGDGFIDNSKVFGAIGFL